MDTTNTNLHSAGSKFAPTYVECSAVELLTILLTDVATDIEVAARDAGISDASFVRLRRVMDRVACVQSVLEAMGMRSVGTSNVGVESDESLKQAAMRGAMDLLVREWPEDYPTGAVEWHFLGKPAD